MSSGLKVTTLAAAFGLAFVAMVLFNGSPSAGASLPAVAVGTIRVGAHSAVSPVTADLPSPLKLSRIGYQPTDVNSSGSTLTVTLEELIAEQPVRLAASTSRTTSAKRG